MKKTKKLSVWNNREEYSLEMESKIKIKNIEKKRNKERCIKRKRRVESNYEKNKESNSKKDKI